MNDWAVSLAGRATDAYRRQADATEAATREVAADRLRHTSPDRTVTVVVDGNGNIQHLTIAQGTLRGPHALSLANSIQTALNEVRRTALTRRAELIARKLEQP